MSAMTIANHFVHFGKDTKRDVSMNAAPPVFQF